jgi:WD40 repeat protein
VILWDVHSRSQLATLSGHNREALGAAFSRDGRLLASAGGDGKVLLWQVHSRSRLATLTGHHGKVSSVAFSSDGRTIASAGADGETILWEIRSRSRLARLTGHSLGTGVEGVAFSPDGRTLASGGEDGQVLLWQVHSRVRLATLAGHKGTVFDVAFSPDGRTLASAGTVPNKDPFGKGLPGEVMLWDVHSRSRLATLTGHKGDVSGVAFSPDGRTLASAGIDRENSPGLERDGLVVLWDVHSRSRQARLRTSSFSVYGVAFSPDGQTLASAHKDVGLWDVHSLSWLAALGAHNSESQGVSFSPDGRTLASADNEVNLWDIRSRSLLATLTGSSDTVYDVAFSPDGRTLASTDDKMVVLWHTDVESLPYTLCSIAGSDLSEEEWAELLPDQNYRKACA